MDDPLMPSDDHVHNANAKLRERIAALVREVLAERDVLAAIVRDHAVSRPEEQIAAIRVCTACGGYNKAVGPLDFVRHRDNCTWMRARVWSEGQQS